MNLFLTELPIGLDLKDVLLHLLNFGILLIGIRFLLYKPIKKFINKREQEYKEQEEYNLKLKKEAEEKKKRYEDLSAEAESRIAKISEETAEKTQKNAAVILEQAKEEAKEIIDKARQDAEAEKKKALPEIKEKSGELGIVIAEKILNRRITEEDSEKMIDECIKEWSRL